MFQIAVELPAHPSCDVSDKFEVQEPDRAQVRGMQWAMCCMCVDLLPCQGGTTLHSLLETLILKTCSGQPSMRIVTFFVLVLAALSLNQNKSLREQGQLFFEICVREREWEQGLLWDWYCHTTDVIVPLLTAEPWLSLSRSSFASDNKPNSCPQLNIFSCTTYVHFWSLDYFFFSSLHLFFCLWGTLVTMEMTTSSGWVDLRAE